VSTSWSGRRVTEARAVMAQRLPAPCGKCGRTVTALDAWAIGHIKPRALHPELTWDQRNWQIEHRACSDASGQSVVIEKARAEGAAGFPQRHPGPESSPLPQTHTGGALADIPARLRWDNPANRTEWLQDLLDVPDDAAPPLAMTPPHPKATGSYGPAAIAWVKAELGIELRWWQRLAFCRQLEHDAAGRLVWRTVVESGPRRIGKSIRLRAMALWRLDHADLFGEEQLAIHTGKDVAIVREIHRQAWSWATERDDWSVRKGVGQEEVIKGAHRWLVRSTDAVYGYSVCLGMVDEAWAVAPATYSEGLEPATMERSSPQLLLTSTAHRRATSLMKTKITEALTADDGETLLLLWAAPPDADVTDPTVWKAASPHWSPDRERMIRAKLEQAQAGEAAPEADDPDPLAGFTAQYLCQWQLTERAAGRGEPLITEDDWAALATTAPNRAPDGAAVESWFGEGVTLALAWKVGDRVVAACIDHADMPAAAAALKATGFKRTPTIGASLLENPAFTGVRARKGQGRTGDAIRDLGLLLSEGVLLHDGSGHLAAQAVSVRTLPGADGPRVASKGRADALKAAAWAVADARRPSLGIPRFIT
jgi:hypothetical protein